MAKSKRTASKRGTRLHRGPFTGKEIEAALLKQGYVVEPGGRHTNLSHPERAGKVSVSSKWTGIKAGSRMFKSVARQSGYGDAALLRILNDLPPTGEP